MRFLFFAILALGHVSFAENRCSDIFTPKESFLVDPDWYRQKLFRDGWIRVLSAADPAQKHVGILRDLTAEALRYADDKIHEKLSFSSLIRRGGFLTSFKRYTLFEELAKYAVEHMRQQKVTLVFYHTFVQTLLEIFDPAALAFIDKESFIQNIKARELQSKSRLERVRTLPVFYEPGYFEYFAYSTWLLPIPVKFGRSSDIAMIELVNLYSEIGDRFNALSEAANFEIHRIQSFLGSGYLLKMQKSERKVLTAFIYLSIFRDGNWKRVIRLFNDRNFRTDKDFVLHLQNTLNFLDNDANSFDFDQAVRAFQKITVDYTVETIKFGVVFGPAIWS